LGGEEAIRELTVFWPSGAVDRHRGIPSGHLVSLKEGTREVDALPFEDPAETQLGPAAADPEPAATRTGIWLTEATPAPQLRGRTLDGGEFLPENHRGRRILLNFWATWCGPCRTEMPWFVEFQDRYRDSGFTVLAVSVDQEGWEVVRPFIEEQGLNFPVFVGDRDFGEAFGGVNVLPTTFIVDRTGKITARHRGLIDKSEYEKEIEALL
jgi:cytochrome c biogenesis protein CcmG/thiol:disulfide interchange protein DsbE